LTHKQNLKMELFRSSFLISIVLISYIEVSGGACMYPPCPPLDGPSSVTPIVTEDTTTEGTLNTMTTLTAVEPANGTTGLGTSPTASVSGSSWFTSETTEQSTVSTTVRPTTSWGAVAGITAGVVLGFLFSVGLGALAMKKRQAIRVWLSRLSVCRRGFRIHLTDSEETLYEISMVDLARQTAVSAVTLGPQIVEVVSEFFGNQD
jgi:hypothetical protein